jgi:hypothetical protein
VSQTAHHEPQTHPPADAAAFAIPSQFAAPLATRSNLWRRLDALESDRAAFRQAAQTGSTNDPRRINPPIVDPADAEQTITDAHRSVLELSTKLRQQNAALNELRATPVRRTPRRAVIYGLAGVVPAATIVAVAVAR